MVIDEQFIITNKIYIIYILQNRTNMYQKAALLIRYITYNNIQINYKKICSDFDSIFNKILLEYKRFDENEYNINMKYSDIRYYTDTDTEKLIKQVRFLNKIMG
jgi:hypothetical protein